MIDLMGAEQYECVIRKSDDADGWVAEYPDVPGVGAWGSTRAEAAQFGEEVLIAWLDKARELGVEIPSPGEAKTATGEFKARLPKTLHYKLYRLGQIYGVSLNEIVSRLLTIGVARTFSPEVSGGDRKFLCVNLPCKPPQTAPGLSREVHEFSGTWIQRIPRVLHVHLQRLAIGEGTSMSTLVLYLLASESGALSRELLLMSEHKGTQIAA